MKDNREKLNIYSILAIFMLITIVVSASFAFLGKFNLDLNGSVAVNINASAPGNISFVTSSSDLNLQVPAANMTDFDSNNTVAIAENFATINVSLLGTSDFSTRCTYDVVFEYDLSSNIYGVSPTTKTSGANKEITFEVEGPTGTSNPFVEETNIDYSTSKGWIAKTSTTGARIKLVTGATITNNGGTESTQTFKVTARYYNLDAFQSQLAGKAFTGKIYADNLNCEGT